MVDISEIRALMARENITNEDMAKRIGMTPKTFRNRMKTGNFWTKELEAIATQFGIENPGNFFYPKKCI